MFSTAITAGEVDELAALDVPHGGVLGALGDDRVDLTYATRNSGGTALQDGFVSLAHGVLIGRTIKRPWSKDDDGGQNGVQRTMIELHSVCRAVDRVRRCHHRKR